MDDRREEEGGEAAAAAMLREVPKPNVDGEARWIRKAGQLRFGYKRHTVTDPNGMILAEETTAARALGRGADAHRAHVRGKGDLDEQEYHQDDETLDEDRGDDLGTSLGGRVRCLKSSPSHG